MAYKRRPRESQAETCGEGLGHHGPVISLEVGSVLSPYRTLTRTVLC